MRDTTTGRDKLRFPVEKLRADFPLLTKEPIAYLDNSATSQKPKSVLDAVERFYFEENANPMRGLYELSIKATEAYEKARVDVARFLGAEEKSCVVFTRNATESLNLLANSLSELLLSEGDEIVISVSEHHSNMLPWVAAARRHKAKLRLVLPEKTGEITGKALEEVLSDRTKIVSLTHMSNVFGFTNDIDTLAQLAHSKGAVFVADGSQSVPHMPIDLSKTAVDFMAFSGHKMLAPFGIGVLYGKKEWIEKLPPFLLGGEMIESVNLNTGETLSPLMRALLEAKQSGQVEGAPGSLSEGKDTTGWTIEPIFADAPHRFEAGTVNAGGAVGLSAAIAYLKGIGMKALAEREAFLSSYAYERLAAIPHLTLIGSKKPEEHHGIMTFTMEGVHPHDVAAVCGQDGVCIRAGHHCAQPLHQYLGIPSTNRASLMFYNTTEEIDRLVETLRSLRRRLGKE